MVSEQFVVFQLASKEYAIPISQVKKIVLYNSATKPLNTPTCIDGIINLRRKVTPGVDLAEKSVLSIKKGSAKKEFIMEAADQEVGLVVDSFSEIIRLEDSEIEVTNRIAQFSKAIRSRCKVDTRLMIILDLNKLFTHDEMIVTRQAGD